MIKPRALCPGGRIAIIAPSSPFDPEAFARGVARLRALGFEPAWDERVFARDGYLAGSPRDRAASVGDAWRDPAVAAVIAARGGYGSAQLLPFLDPVLARAARKPFVGYSDVTSLLTFLSCQCGVVCFHGPHVAGPLGEEAPGGFDEVSLVATLGRPEPAGELPAPGLQTVVPGEAAGPLFGGNLAVLGASLGTPFAFDPPAGCVLFLDEVGERPYRLDRLLTQFRLAGLLDRAVALVFGQLPGCDEPGGSPTARSVVERAAHGFQGPVVLGLPSGHTRGPALTLPLGVRTRVVAGARARVIVEEAAVAGEDA